MRVRDGEISDVCGTVTDLGQLTLERPGHDRRYAIDASKIERDLGWRPAETFESGLAKTVRWYIENDWWWKPTRDGRYAGERLGVPDRAAS